MQQGKLLSTGTPNEITAAFKQNILGIKANNMHQLLKDLNAYDKAEDAYSFGEYHHAVMKNNYREDELRNYLEQKGNTGLIIQNIQPTIEDSFMQLMKN